VLSTASTTFKVCAYCLSFMYHKYYDILLYLCDLLKV
jgi:hypothetical protein